MLDQVYRLNSELQYKVSIIFDDLTIKYESPRKPFCDSKSANNIAHNLVQHDSTKHIEIDHHFIKWKLDTTACVPSGIQLAIVLTKRDHREVSRSY
ncbi:hypothetical protein Lal_00029519 [Lupinus albus]|nr:hypothetical protein Lal_00029519 [Lupinus albus]